MDKVQMLNILILVLILGAFGMMIFVIWFATTNSYSCINQPFIFGASKMENVYCSCVKYPKKSYEKPAFFEFNDTDFWNTQVMKQNIKNYPEFSDLNFSNIVVRREKE